MTTRVVLPRCIHCGKRGSMEVPDEVAAALRDPNRPKIQDLLPAMSAEQREMLMTGTHPECWDEMFAGMEED